MVTTKFHNMPSTDMMIAIYKLLTLYPNEMVYMDGELWVYWNKRTWRQVQEISEQLDGYGWPRGFDFYESQYMYEAMFLITEGDLQ